MKDRNYKLSGILYLLCTVLWSFCAVMNFMDGEKLSGGIDVALACFFLGVSFYHFKRAKDQDKNSK